METGFITCQVYTVSKGQSITEPKLPVGPNCPKRPRRQVLFVGLQYLTYLKVLQNFRHSSVTILKNADSQQPSQAALTFLIRQDFFLLEFSGKKSSLPLVALLWHIIQHFWLPASNKLVASTANICKFFLSFFFFLACGCSVAHLLTRLFSPSFWLSLPFVKDQLALCSRFCLSLSSSPLLVCVSGPSPGPHCL